MYKRQVPVYVYESAPGRHDIYDTPRFVQHPAEQQPIEYVYWSVNRLGYSISIPIARCNRRVKYLVSISIPIYLTNTRQVQRDLHNMRLFLGELCEIVDRHLLWRMSSEKYIGTTDYCSWDRYVKLSIDTYLFLWPKCSKIKRLSPIYLIKRFREIGAIACCS